MEVDTDAHSSVPLNQAQHVEATSSTDSAAVAFQPDAAQMPIESTNAHSTNTALNLPPTDAAAQKKERNLAEFFSMMDEYTPVIPDLVTDYYLSKAGFDCEDVKIKRLLALAAQKFVADVASDAFHFCKIRQQGSRDKKTAAKEKKVVLNMEDLSAALSEHGMNVRKPDFYSA